MGTGGDASVVVNFESGEARDLAKLIDDYDLYRVTQYSDDGRHALVTAGLNLWLVPLNSDEPARSLGEGYGFFLPGGDEVAIRRGARVGRLVAVSVNGDDERTLASGLENVGPVLTDEGVALIGDDGLALLDPATGGITDVLDDIELDSSSAVQARGALVATADDGERRWFVIDESGAELAELRGLDGVAGSSSGAVLFADGGGDNVAAWDPETASVIVIDVTARQGDVLAAGPQEQVHVSPGGHYAVGGFGGPGQAAVLADLRAGSVVDLDEDFFGGIFSPDDRWLVVTEGGPEPVRRIIEAAQPDQPGIDFGDGAVTFGWVFP